MGIEWKPISNYPGYSVSNTGLVRSERRVIVMKNGVTRTVKGKIISQYCDGNGYPMAHLGRLKKIHVHRLVAEAFLDKIDGKCEVNHKDENKKNNCVENLEWVTRLENLRYGTRNERCQIARMKRAKPVVAIQNGQVIKQYASVHEAERQGYNRYCIRKCCVGKQKEHLGLEWQYAKAENTSAEI